MSGVRADADADAALAAALVEPDAAARPASATTVLRSARGPVALALSRLNGALAVGAALALVAASLILTGSVAVRALFRTPTYWQDEAAVFLIVGATFGSAAFVQERRGHIGIEALVGLLPAGVNRVRLVLVDVASLAFCGFFAWKSWTLFHEAYVDGQVTSSTWGPPLAIPYGIMAAGMSLLSVQLAVQVAAALAGRAEPVAAPAPEDRH